MAAVWDRISAERMAEVRRTLPPPPAPHAEPVPSRIRRMLHGPMAKAKPTLRSLQAMTLLLIITLAVHLWPAIDGGWDAVRDEPSPQRVEQLAFQAYDAPLQIALRERVQRQGCEQGESYRYFAGTDRSDLANLLLEACMEDVLRRTTLNMELPRFTVLQQFDLVGAATGPFLAIAPSTTLLIYFVTTYLARFAARRTDPLRLLGFALASLLAAQVGHWLLSGLAYAELVPWKGAQPWQPLADLSPLLMAFLATVLHHGVWERPMPEGRPVWIERALRFAFILGIGFAVHIVLSPVAWTSWEAHLSGFLAGFAFWPLFRHGPAQHRARWRGYRSAIIEPA